MKRIIAVLLAACLALSLMACAPSVPSSASSDAAPVQASSSSSASSSVERPDIVDSAEMKSLPMRDYTALQEEVAAIAGEYYVDAGIAFIDLSAGPGSAFAVRGDWSCVSASMIKLAVLAAFLDGVDRGEYSLGESYTLQASDIVGGTGSLQGRGAGAQTSYGEMARLMISESDNTAANVLIRRMGVDAVNAEAKKLGLTGTQLKRLMMDEEAMGANVENRMSANDVARILELIWRGELVSPEASRFALEALEAQADGAGIRQGLPAGIMFAHKTGTLAQVRNDGGIVEAEKPYALVVMCIGSDSATAEELMSRVSEAVYTASQKA